VTERERERESERVELEREEGEEDVLIHVYINLLKSIALRHNKVVNTSCESIDYTYLI
jgi:hypothetical protein